MLETTKVIDISHWDGEVKFDLIPKDVGAIFIKATESIGNVDPMFQKNWLQAKNFGFLRGAYHFYHPNQGPIQQANHFVNTVGELESLDFPLILDLEQTNGLSSSAIAASVQVFLDEIEAKTKRVPIFYSYVSFLEDLKLKDSFRKYPLWIAEYGVRLPRVPDPWTKWNFWQYSETAHIPGIPTKCDVNVFNGSQSDLKAFIAGSKITA